LRKPRAYYTLFLLLTKQKHFIRQLRKLLGFYPLHLSYYKTAFRHRSASLHEGNATINNERLEFLGDAILDAIVSDYLYELFPDEDEGFLTRMRAKIVQRKTMNHIANSMDLQNFLVIDTKSNMSTDRILGNALEALVGAIYLDRSYRATRYFIVKNYLKRIDFSVIQEAQYDHKSKLYHLIQDKKWKLVFETHEHIEDCEHSAHFLSIVKINDAFIAEGKAWTKKEAEQEASKMALEKIIS
jgi:ribonuclease-3